MDITLSMFGVGIIDALVDFIVGFFAFIPQFMYFIYASIASFLDLLQYLVRKLAGLDIYYVDGKAVSGDLIVEFIQGILGIKKDATYSAISTVFWSLVIFGVILLILCTIVAIIKAHYNYDQNKSQPTKILTASIKSLFTFAIVPIVVVLGVYLSQILLKALDSATSYSSSASLNDVFESNAVNKFKAGEDANGNLCYSSYDYFSAGNYCNSPTFSGMLFQVAAYSCNRVRENDFSVVTSQSDKSKWDNMDVFYVQSGTSNQKENLASQIDYAFANNLTLKTPYDSVKIEWTEDAADLGSSLHWGYSGIISVGLYNVKSFSKFNVGLVWYYYDLWAFNWILGFAGVFICATLFGNIVFGLMARMLQIVALFIVFPAFIGIMPLDEGAAFVNWRKQFMSDILMAFGAIVGLNIFFLILPFFNEISFFNNYFLDGIMNMIIIIAGITLVKKFINLVSKFIGASDANETGSSVRQEALAAAVKGVSGTMGAAKLGVLGFKPRLAATKTLGRFVGGKIQKKVKASPKYQAKADDKVRKMLGKDSNYKVTDQDRKAFANLQKLDKTERKVVLGQYNDKMQEAANEKDPAARQAKEANAKKALLKELGAGTGRGAEASRKAFIKHVDNTAERKYKRARVVASVFGGNPDDVKKGKATVDEKGDVVYEKGEGAFKAIGKAAVDFGSNLIKGFGKLTGASQAWKKLGESGAIDDAKSAIQSLMSAGGAGAIGKAVNNASIMRTSSQQEDDKLAKAEESRREAMREPLQATNKSLAEIVDLLKQLTGSASASRATSSNPRPTRGSGSGATATPPSSPTAGGSGGGTPTTPPSPPPAGGSGSGGGTP